MRRHENIHSEVGGTWEIQLTDPTRSPRYTPHSQHHWYHHFLYSPHISSSVHERPRLAHTSTQSASEHAAGVTFRLEPLESVLAGGVMTATFRTGSRGAVERAPAQRVRQSPRLAELEAGGATMVTMPPTINTITNRSRRAASNVSSNV